MSEITIRPEKAGDEPAIFTVNSRAFDTGVEAALVDALRGSDTPILSLVALQADEIVGHIVFSPVSVENNPEGRSVWGLGPMSVLPEHQRRGVGSSLVRSGLAGCGAQGVEVVVVLGHAEYYPRFGFLPAGPRGLHFRDVEFDPYFMVQELVPGAMASLQGFVEYASEFDEA